MTTQEFIQRLEQRIQQRSLLTHPFYQAWTEGKLTIPMLKEYAAQYYHNEVAFPTYLSAVHSRCSSLPVRQAILANLWDEEYGDKNHPELWLRFCEALGLSREEVEGATVLPETQSLIETYRDITAQRSTPEGLAALYAYERQVPAIAEQKIEGLKRFYGISDPRALEFLTVHMDLDKAHSAAERQIIGDYAKDDDSQAAVEKALDEALEAQWRFLDGVSRAIGLDGC